MVEDKGGASEERKKMEPKNLTEAKFLSAKEWHKGPLEEGKPLTGSKKAQKEHGRPGFTQDR